MTSILEVEKTIKTGDLLLWRPEDAYGRAICVGSKSQYSHAGTAVWIQQPGMPWRLYSMDMLAGPGGVTQPLVRMVERWPGLIDVYEANAGDRWPEWDGVAAAQYFMDNFLGLEYGAENARIAARTEIWIVRLFCKPNHDDDAVAEGPPFCSHAIAAAAKDGGNVDPVPNLSAAFTWPGDLAESPFYSLKHEELTL